MTVPVEGITSPPLFLRHINWYNFRCCLGIAVALNHHPLTHFPDNPSRNVACCIVYHACMLCPTCVIMLREDLVFHNEGIVILNGVTGTRHQVRRKGGTGKTLSWVLLDHIAGAAWNCSAVHHKLTEREPKLLNIRVVVPAA